MTFNYKRSGMWWPMDIQKAADRGAQLVMFNTQYSGTVNDWSIVHDTIENMRRSGIDLQIIRAPAPRLGPGTYDQSFDEKYIDHIFAFAVDDEAEDKQWENGARLDWWANVPAIINLLVPQVQALKRYMGGVKPVFYNGNGTHVTTPDQDGGRSQSLYRALAAAGVDLFCQDNYYFTDNQMVPWAAGKVAGPPIYDISAVWTPSDLIRQWTGRPTWLTLETGNQGDHALGDPAWGEDPANPKKVFAGSRSLTPAEVVTIVGHAPDGIMWFQQGHGGRDNDVTDPKLEDVIRQVNKVFAGATLPVPPAVSHPPIVDVPVGGNGGVMDPATAIATLLNRVSKLEAWKTQVDTIFGTRVYPFLTNLGCPNLPKVGHGK